MSGQVDISAKRRGPDGFDNWVVVLEATTDGAAFGFTFGAVQDLLGRLREWQPLGLYNARRYAVQLHVAGTAPADAVRRALALHDRAARAAGVAPRCVTRTEVWAAGERETGLVAHPLPPGTPTGRATVSEELYRTTRALLRVSTPSEITELLVHFVSAVGALVTVGMEQPVPGMVSVAISIGDDEPLYAVAETLSVPGLIIEQALRPLVEDAWLALRQLHESVG